MIVILAVVVADEHGGRLGFGCESTCGPAAGSAPRDAAFRTHEPGGGDHTTLSSAAHRHQPTPHRHWQRQAIAAGARPATPDVASARETRRHGAHATAQCRAPVPGLRWLAS